MTIIGHFGVIDDQTIRIGKFLKKKATEVNETAEVSKV
jgi:hypothetical protein